MDWQDVSISGLAESNDMREAVVKQVESLPGVRLARGGNQLQVRGWLQIDRKDGVMTVSGLLPKGETQFLRFLDDVKLDAQGEVSRAEWVAPPAGVMEWNEFVGVFFDGPGSRAVELRGGTIVLGGEATPELQTVWLATAAKVVGEGAVVDRLTVRAAIRDFEGYMPKGIDDREVLRKLREVLAGSVVMFDPESSAVSEEERAKVAAVAAAILDGGGTAKFLLEGFPTGGVEGGPGLGVKRATEVERLLLEYGVPPEQLDLVEFGAGGDKDPGHRVEITIN